MKTMKTATPALRPGFPKEDYQEREAKKEAEREANGGAPSMGSGRAAGFAQNPVAMDGATIMLAGGGVRRPGSGGTANIVVDPRNVPPGMMEHLPNGGTMWIRVGRER